MEEPLFCSHYHKAFHSLAPVHHLQSFAKHTRACHSFHRAQHLRIGRNFISRARKQMLKSRVVGLTPCSEFTVEAGVWSQNPCPPAALLSPLLARNQQISTGKGHSLHSPGAADHPWSTKNDVCLQQRHQEFTIHTPFHENLTEI